MTKRNARNRRHGTNEMAGDAATLRRKGRGSPTIGAAENGEYTMIDLVRSVERLHFCKSGEKKETVLWADVKKYYKKYTGCVLTTEVFNKLAGVSGMGRKDLIAGPLAGLLVAEDPAALVLRFKYDATKGDPLINHRFFLEATGAKTSVHHANDSVSPTLADVTNTVSPSRSETSSSLSPTCLSSISTDPDTEALSPRSASSPLSSGPLSPETREYVTANDGDLPTGEQSFLTARTSPITSDWETSPSMSSREDTSTPESPLNRSTDQERTLNIFDVSHGAADTTIGASKVLEEMDSPVKEETVKVEEEKTTVKAEETKKEKEEEEVEEEESDKENHEESSPAAVKPLEEKEEEVSSPPLSSPIVTKDEEKDVIEVPDAVREEVVVTTTPEEKKETEEEEVVHDVIQTPVEEGKEKEEQTEPTAAPAEPVAQVEEEKKEEEGETGGEQREEEEEEGVQHDLAAGDGPIPPQSSPVISSESVQHEVDAAAAAAAASSPVTTSSSDEHLLTVIERVAVVPPAAVDEEEEHKEEPEAAAQPEEKVEDMEVEEKEEEEVIAIERKEEELLAHPFVRAEDAVMKQQDLTTSVEEKRVKMEEEKEDEESEKKEEKRVEEMMQVEPSIETPPEDEEEKKEEDVVEVVDTVVQSEAVLEVDAVPQSVEVAAEETATSTTEEPTATTMVAATVVPLQEVQPVQQQPLPSPVLEQPPPSAHEPMDTISLLSSCSSLSSPGRHHIERPPSPSAIIQTSDVDQSSCGTSDDVDMHDVLAGGPNRDVHTPSVTAPITLQPKPVSRAEPEDDTEVITSQPVVDETDAATSAAAAASPAKGDTAASPDLALRRAAPAKKFPCCTIV